MSHLHCKIYQNLKIYVLSLLNAKVTSLYTVDIINQIQIMNFIIL